MSQSIKFKIRIVHRYLGIIIGIQFLFWTIGGLYFSWTNIAKIRGKDIVRDEENISLTNDLISPSSIIFTNEITNSFKSIELVPLLDSFYYKVITQVNEKDVTIMLNAKTGIKRKLLTIAEAKTIVSNRLKLPTSIDNVSLITSTNGHHEYREKPLPAYALSISKPYAATVYVDATTGEIHNVRNNQWRVFDWLWMMHVMDYKDRDNINNWVLRIFSLLGLCTLISGYVLYFTTIKKN